MTLADIYFRHFSMMQYVDFTFRLLIAFFIGGSIGLERSNHFKEAGIRTHILVRVTSALIMIISKYGFADLGTAEIMTQFGTKGADTARVAAQAVSGISFLCAGVIIKVGTNIKGLTTAAGIWMTAGVGLAIGAGMYFVVGVTMVLLWIVQFISHKMPFGADSYDSYHVVIKVHNTNDFDQKLRNKLDEWKMLIAESNITWSREGETVYDLVLRCAEAMDYSDIKTFVAENDEIVSYSYSPLTRRNMI